MSGAPAPRSRHNRAARRPRLMTRHKTDATMPRHPSPYRLLGLTHAAPLAAVRAAFAAAARRHHPDRGGNAQAFAAARAAYETLADPERRAAYDAAAREGEALGAGMADADAARRTRAPAGGEADLLAALGSFAPVAPDRQLVVTCATCGRPATVECYICATPLCAFCTRARHAAPGVKPHWPLIDSPHMEDALARRQLEAKRLADAAAADAAVPGARDGPSLAAVRALRDAWTGGDDAARAAAAETLWAWAQTDGSVFVAVAVPPGEPDRPPEVSVDGSRLRVAAFGFPPTLDGELARGVARDPPPRVAATGDGRVALITLAKAPPYGGWKRLLSGGQGDWARCVEPPYSVVEADDCAAVEFAVPPWVRTDDVRVSVTPDILHVRVEGVLDVTRRFWWVQGGQRHEVCLNTTLNNLSHGPFLTSSGLPPAPPWSPTPRRGPWPTWAEEGWGAWCRWRCRGRPWRATTAARAPHPKTPTRPPRAPGAARPACPSSRTTTTRTAWGTSWRRRCWRRGGRRACGARTAPPESPPTPTGCLPARAATWTRCWTPRRRREGRSGAKIDENRDGSATSEKSLPSPLSSISRRPSLWAGRRTVSPCQRGAEPARGPRIQTGRQRGRSLNGHSPRGSPPCRGAC